MSQEKVDRYKNEKANRKKIMKKQKIKHAMSLTLVTLICVVCVGYIGYSAYGLYESNKTVETTEVNIDAINEYLNSVS